MGMLASMGIFSILFFAVFALVIVIFIVTFARSIGQWNKNNHSPRLTVAATVVAKRMQVSHHHHANEMSYHHTSTYYYVTFEVESGDRFELLLSGQEYGLLIEGDRGRLTFQGTRYLAFERM